MFRKRGFAAFIVSFLLLTFVFAFPSTTFASDVVTIKAVPLYRCWDGYVHWYTSNVAERDGWLASGFSDEGIACYVSPVPLPYTVPLYKSMLYNDMYYTTDSAIRDAVAGQYGYTYIGIEGYVIPANDTSYGDVNVNQWYRPEPDNSDGWEWLSGKKFSVSQRHHFYQVDPGKIPGYSYEGVAFRAWKSSESLQKIKVIAPNGGESYKAGDVVDIKWTSITDGGEMNLYYGMNGPASTTLYKIEEGLSNNGNYKWTVPSKTGSNIVIEARWLYYDNETDSSAYANDTSDSGFSITGSGSIMTDITMRPEIDLSAFKIFPSAPTGLTVNPYMFSRLDLFWKDNSDNETGFVIERKTQDGSYAQIATVGADITKYSDTSATLDTTYFYRVKATSEFDSAYSNEASGTLRKVALKPNIDLLISTIGIESPKDLKASSVSSDPNAVKLSWKASDSDIDGYLIERKSGTGNWEMSSSSSADKTNVTETGLKTNTIYSYRVKAYKLYMNSEPSNIIEFNTAVEKTLISDQIDLDFFIDDAIYKINDIASILDVSPVIKEGRTLIPIRYVTEPIGADIQWIDEEKKIIINQGTTIIELWIGKNKAEINGRSVLIDPDNDEVIPLIINGRTMMPLRFIAENLGCEVKWIPKNKQIKIIYQGNKLDPQPEPPNK